MQRKGPSATQGHAMQKRVGSVVLNVVQKAEDADDCEGSWVRITIIMSARGDGVKCIQRLMKLISERQINTCSLM